MLTVLNKMQHEHINLLEYLNIRNDVKCEFIDIQDRRIRDLSIGDGRGLGPFRVGISPELKAWMKANNIPINDKSYNENLFFKRFKYFTLFIVNYLRPWLAKHAPESLRKYARMILRK